MRLKPGIDAIYMEDMKAIRQQSDPLPFFEIVQANRTFIGRALNHLVSSISKCGDCLDRQFVEPTDVDHDGVLECEDVLMAVAVAAARPVEMAEGVRLLPV